MQNKSKMCFWIYLYERKEPDKLFMHFLSQLYNLSQISLINFV